MFASGSVSFWLLWWSASVMMFFYACFHLLFSFLWLIQVWFLRTLFFFFCEHWWGHIVWNWLQDTYYRYGYYVVGCSGCWFQGQKAWDSSGFKSSSGCINWVLLGQVSSKIWLLISTFSAVCYFHLIFFYYYSEPWKRPSFSSVMESLRSLIKPPTPQPGLAGMTLLAWSIGTSTVFVHIIQHSFENRCLTGIITV